jgi:iron complex transport system substrate-binding protein
MWVPFGAKSKLIFMPLTRALASLMISVMTLISAAHALPVTDDHGVTFSLAQPPQRIVSLLPSLTETVCALGQCQRLVGVDRDSNFPDSVRVLTRVGGGLDPNIEAIVALRPDVVLLASSSRTVERLQALGLKVLALEPKTHADLQRVLTQVGRLLDVADTDRLWREIDAGVLAAAQSLPVAARSSRIYFEASSGPYAASEASFIGETLTRLGVRNIVSASLGPFPKLNPEYVVRADPDLIMLGDPHAPGIEQRPGWSAMRAVREQRVCRFTAAQSDVLVRPGPRLAQAARIMAQCLTDKAGKKAVGQLP